MGPQLIQVSWPVLRWASNISDSRCGVAARLLAEDKCAVYTHCYGHGLNLAVGTTIYEGVKTKNKYCQNYGGSI